MNQETLPAQGPVDVNVRRKRCQYCDDTGDVHGLDGEWRGVCNCGAAEDMEERYLLKQLAILQESYAKAAKPYINRLVAIQCLKPPPPMVVMGEQAQVLGLTPENSTAE